jgi:Protein of unknown function, DUF547
MNRMLKMILFSVLIGNTFNIDAQEHLKHTKWTALLQKYVKDDGMLNYSGLKKEESKLDDYLKVLSSNHPKASWKKNDRLAFWINAYNAFTVKLIIKSYPVKSIKDLGGSIYKVNTPWDIKFIRIGNETYDLNNIEHGIIRKKFEEPRIHFAVNCASVSCPNLRNEAYVGNRLDKQLNEQAKSFINDKSKNVISGKKAQLSKIFRWFKGDFSKKDSNFIKFINSYSDIKITKSTIIEYLDYSWKLNE